MAATSACIRIHHCYDAARRAFIRPRHLNFSPASTANNFAHVCLRKLYVLSSRGEGNQGPHGCLLQVAQVCPDWMHCYLYVDTLNTQHLVWLTTQVALPVLLARMEVILREFLVEQSLSISESGERALMSDVMCVLEVRYARVCCHRLRCCRDKEVNSCACRANVKVHCRCVQVLATMTLSPLVVDAVTDHYASAVPLLQHVRQRAAKADGRRERSHLLFLHPLVIECICAREQRVRDMLQDVLRLTAAELGLQSTLTPEAL